MPAPTYENFELAIQPTPTGYVARVLDSPGGTGKAEFQLPFTPAEIAALLAQLESPGVTQAPDGGDPLVVAIKKFGGRIFQAVFSGDVRACWQASLVLTASRGQGLRLRLRLNDAPQLADLPWELLYDPAVNRFYNQSTQTPLVRYLDLPEPPRPLTVTPPLKILVVISLPDAQPAAAEQEWQNLNTALADLVKRGLVTLERTDDATLSALQRKLRQSSYHILHFIGHGVYDPPQQTSYIKFASENGGARLVDGETLGTLLYDDRSLRFVFLNAGQGARTGGTEPFSGVAESLIRQGIPAIIAMQFTLSDHAALIFSQGVYEALADSYPLDAALSEARKTIFFESADAEWATPVFYSRAPDGVFFNVTTAPNIIPPPARTDEPAPAAQPVVKPAPQPAPAAAQPAPYDGADILAGLTALLGNKMDSAASPPTPAPTEPQLNPNFTPAPPNEFNPVGRWNIQVQDMVGSRMLLELEPNGMFQMLQQVGMYQVPATGTWAYNPYMHQLGMQGVVNNFQPFMLGLTIMGQVPAGFTAVGTDGIGYLLTRAA